ncbi:phosphatase PAP2 family protein [Erwinia tasmaniensis]|uniref:Phosphoesterase n=1 Tax=Erwinia tasmaniensis (strain DSM 17950 / CFBP 7177 / CIP 109463 / NCPPB 4357 / Et1/99) TaxID=465817 RepID=B2VC51_ERWT9|nr:phosphatase PAP2 family protein [Erwinia tasmaniensis]CAO97229.1 Putative phosphoesterase [Erwinia tasmaniensis Et1/99]
MKPSVNLNISQTTRHIRRDPLYPLTARFYLKQFVLLVLTALFFIWLSRDESWDMALTRLWFDPVNHQFPWKDNRWLDVINHRLLKDLVIGGGVLLLLAGLLRRQARWVLVALMMGIGPLVVGILKSGSTHSCPWDLVQFGGEAVSYPLFGTVPANSGPGHCFPGGHASSGFSAMALFFLFYPRWPRLALLYWWIAVAVGLAMGFGQMMRGAHFLSHNLWAAWWVWLTQCVTFGCVTLLFKRRRGIDHDGSAKPVDVSQH